ncbi:unnamed protein product [Ambrosiozyma monospora]|uniref:Unnamed protein product n=1 Tax=Ambrosiozyma monospora TaxID=43982 RepID=A0A9W6WHG2_AMBMO|nr:unnamed protein product [Ambrosiozyma monospora]
MQGPFGWIHRGTVDMIGDIIVPKKNVSFSKDDISINELLKYYKSQHEQEEKEKQKVVIESEDGMLKLAEDNIFIMDFYLRLNNPKASIPLFNSDLSYINNALVRPIVGYINSRKMFIPIRCRVIKDLRDFDGSWTVYDSLLMDDLSLGVYNSFAEYVGDEQFKKARVKKVVFWSLQFLMQFILWSLSTLG